MVKKQIQLSEDQQETLKAVATRTGKSENQLIREALDQYLDSCDDGDKLEKLLAAAGIWKDRANLPDLRVLREEWDARPAGAKGGKKKP